MGWKDAPVASPTSSGWRSAPEAGEGETSALEAGLYGAGQTIAAGHVDEIAGGLAPLLLKGNRARLGKGAQPSPDDTPEIAELKRQLLAEQDAAPTDREILKNAVQSRIDKAQGEHPLEYGVGRIGAGAVMAPLIAAAAPAAGLGGALVTGGAIGGANALGESRANLGRGEFGRYLGDGLIGTALGVGTGGLGYGIAGAFGGGGTLAPTLASGAGTGGIMGTLMSPADTLWGELKDGGEGALWGLAGAGAGYGGARLIGGTANGLVNGFVKPSEEAQYLRDQGVNNLTVGQMAPKSGLGQAEEVGTSAAFVGPKIKAQRAAARETYAKAAVSQVVPEGGGASSPVKGSLNERLADAYRQQGERYDSVRGSPLSSRAAARPVNVKNVGKAFDLASRDPSVLAGEADSAAVSRFLDNQHSILERQGPTPEAFMRVRSNIRKQAASLPEGNARRQLLDRAEQTITNRLQYALPKEALQTLRNTDEGYGAYKAMETAVGNSKDGALTPNDITMGIKSNTDKGAYARGAGGPLRELARAGHEVFDQRVEPTGARLLASGRYNPLPWAVRIANSPAVKPYVLGEAPIQQKVAGLIQALRAGTPQMSPTSGLAPEALGFRRYLSEALASYGQGDDDAKTASR